MKESEIQKQILDVLQLLENKGKVYCFKAAAGGIKTDTGRFFKTGKAGCPDIVCCIDGKFVGFEVKTKKGRQTDNQVKAEEAIKKAGGSYLILRSLDDLLGGDAENCFKV